MYIVSFAGKCLFDWLIDWLIGWSLVLLNFIMGSVDRLTDCRVTPAIQLHARSAENATIPARQRRESSSTVPREVSPAPIVFGLAPGSHSRRLWMHFAMKIRPLPQSTSIYICFSLCIGPRLFRFCRNSVEKRLLCLDNASEEAEEEKGKTHDLGSLSDAEFAELVKLHQIQVTFRRSDPLIGWSVILFGSVLKLAVVVNVVRLIDWSIDWLTDWFVDWSFDWLIDWLVLLRHSVLSCFFCFRDWLWLPWRNSASVYTPTNRIYSFLGTTWM